MGFERIILKIKRGDTPVYRLLKRTYYGLMSSSLPVPRALKPAGNAVYHGQQAAWMLGKRLFSFLVREPLFRSRCESVGKRLSLNLLPEIMGHTTIQVGDDVTFHGKTGIYTGRSAEQARLIIGNKVSIGHQAVFSCNQEIVIEDNVYIANSCSFSDNDGHPIDPELRSAGLPPDRSRPVRICRQAWIGSGCYVLKGVTVGRAAIIGANSVVTRDIPPFAVAAGNPARVIRMLREESQDNPRPEAHP